MAMQEELEKQGNFLFRYRSYFPLLFLVIGLGYYIFREMNSIGGEETIWSEIYEIICVLVCFLGLGIRIFAVGFSADRTSGRNTREQVADSINTTGIYSVVRHPLYIGNYFMWLGVCMFIESFYFVIIFTLAFWIYYERIMYAEEQFLRVKYGEEYLSWADRTPLIFPKFSQYTRPAGEFKLFKVLRQEKDGLFAFILILFIFKTLKEYFREGRIIVDETWWWVLFILGILIYVSLKVLKSKRKLREKRISQ